MLLFDTPILLLIFNRPQTTKIVFDAIRQLRPEKLFIAADGPRSNEPEDVRLCMEARLLTMKIDWPCEVYRMFHINNLGCGRGPASAISWFFDHVEEGIILEDDINPSPDFFKFCQALLKRYRHDNRVMEIGGVNLIDHTCEQYPYDYYFSNHNHTWGWATWKRAWEYYDFTLKNYSLDIVQQFLRSCFSSSFEYTYFKNLFDATFHRNQQITWWDYQWEFARRINGGLSIVPSKNLITNIGLGDHATHTLDADGVGSDLKWNSLIFPLKHPHFVLADTLKDQYYFKHIFSTPASRLRFTIRRILPALFKHAQPGKFIPHTQLTLNKY